MKTINLVLSILLLAASLSADKIKISDSNQGYRIIDQKSGELYIEYNIKDVTLKQNKTEIGNFTEVFLSKGYLTGKVGTPALPYFNNLIEMPLNSKPEVEILETTEKELDLNSLGFSDPLMPNQPDYEKCVNPKDIYTHINKDSYMQNRYIENSPVKVSIKGNMRGRIVASLSVYPTKYNPVTQKLVVTSKVRFKVRFNGDSEKHIKNLTDHSSPYFDDMHLINASKIDYVDLVKYPVTYLVVASQAIKDNAGMKAKLDEFIAWKKEKGFKVVERYVTASENINQVDSWIEQQYNTLSPKPSFVLLVGDESGTYAVPAAGSTGNTATWMEDGIQRSDLMYGVIGAVSSDNMIQSMYVGRFSVNSADDLAAQVNKTIWYEKTQFTTNANLDYLKNAMVVAGADASYSSTYGNPHVRYAMAWHFNNTYTNPVTGTTNGINGIGHLNGASGQGNNIIGTVNSGVAFYNYTAHGNNNSFWDPNFNTTEVSYLTNKNKYGLIIGNCCLTGSYGDTKCFGEAWLTAPDKGSIGYIGSSMSTVWAEDLVMGIGSEGVHSVNSGDITPPFTPNAPGWPDALMLQKFPTQGGARHCALMSVTTYDGFCYRYWQAYQLFGDPSLMVYIGIPKDMTVTHVASIAAGTTSFTVNAVKNAYVALSDANGVLHGAALANSNGVATINITPFTSGSAKLVVFAAMKKPVFKTIPISGSGGGNPTVNITSPANNAQFNMGSTVNIAATATAPTKSVSKVEFYIDGILKGTDTSSPYQYSWVTTGSSSGTHAIKAIVTDNQNLTAENSISVSLMNGTPQVQITSPANNAQFNMGSTVNIAATATDQAKLVSKVDFYIDGVLKGTDTSSPYQYSWVTTGSSSGTHAIKTIVTDDQNLTAESSISVTLNTSTETIILSEGFENQFPPANWTADTAPRCWYQSIEFPHLGNKCAAVEWNHTMTAGASITTPALALPAVLNKNYVLEFWWIDKDYWSSKEKNTKNKIKTDGYDFTYCEISTNGTSWTEVAKIGGGAAMTQFVKVTVDLTPYQGSAVKIRWRDTNSGNDNSVGTGLDDVKITLQTGSSIDQNLSIENLICSNYPNPFNPETIISFNNLQEGMVNLAVFNSRGEIVEELVNRNLQKGIHSIKFDGSSLNSGIYFYRLTANQKYYTRKMMLLK